MKTGWGRPVGRPQSFPRRPFSTLRDPMHRNGARKFTVRPWFVSEGTVSVRLDYSKGTFAMT
jgi:hypothetical protein